MLLALEAVDETRDGAEALPEAVEALHLAVSSNRLLMDVPGVGGALDWSPTGEVFVTEGQEETGIVDIRDATTGASIREFHGHDIDVNDVAFSADGTLLATSGDDAALRVRDVATGDLVTELLPVDGDAVVWGPSFSPDGSRVAASWLGRDSAPVVHVFDVATGALTQTLNATVVVRDVVLPGRTPARRRGQRRGARRGVRSGDGRGALHRRRRTAVGQRRRLQPGRSVVGNQRRRRHHPRVGCPHRRTGADDRGPRRPRLRAGLERRRLRARRRQH